MKAEDIRVEVINKEFSSLSGLFFLHKIYQKLKIGHFFKSLFRKKTCEKKFKTILFSFFCGADCLDDLDTLREDHLFSQITDGGIASTTAGEFLRSFTNYQIETFCHILTELSLNLRKILQTKNNDFIIMMDSTPHIHYGKKFEGISWNYKNDWCLGSLNCYDQYGFNYFFNLRPGNTYSGNSAETVIQQIFKKTPGHYKKYFRADSAYSRSSVYNALEAHNVKFAIAMKAQEYQRALKENKNFLKWSKTRISFFNRINCQTESASYTSKKIHRSHLRVVLIRTEKDNIKDVPDDDLLIDGYYYYAIATNIAEYEMSDEKIIKLYRGRSNGENYIKDMKYSLDLKHFPCKKLNANRIYVEFGDWGDKS